VYHESLLCHLLMPMSPMAGRSGDFVVEFYMATVYLEV
jgi:hypothetical protein